MSNSISSNRRKLSNKGTLKEDEKRFQRTKEIWTAITKTSLDLRDVEREFHGLQGELRRIAVGIKEQYEKSRSIKHVRDLGARREELLRMFFRESGLLPFKYEISNTSARAIGATGRVSKEIDLLFFDRDENIVLQKFGKTLEFYPSETVLGVIQIKSNLTYAEIDSAFENIASFKKIYDFKEDAELDNIGKRGFGIIFAFETNLTHDKIVDRIKANAEKYQTKDLPNSILILGGSVFRFGDDNGGYLFNYKLDNLTKLQIYGDLDVLGDNFYRFYAELMELLQHRKPQQINLPDYFDLPLVSDDISYRFQFGASSETMKCLSHGSYLRRFSATSAKRVFESASNAAPIHWIKAIDIARGNAGDNVEAYNRQPGEVRIYNPDNIPLDKLLIGINGNLCYDHLIMNGLNVWIPWFYEERDSLFAICPSCQKEQRARERRQKKVDGKSIDSG